MPHTTVVFSEDESILAMIAECLGKEWQMDRCSRPGDARAFLSRRGVGIVVIDDAAIEEPTRGWLLDQVRRLAPSALVAYIASNHAPEIERRARSLGVQYYISRPVDRDRTIRVLHSFVSAVR